MATFRKRSRLEAPADRVFAWHQTPDALSELIPPWEKVRVETPPASLRDGERAVLVMRAGPFKLRWVAEHRGFVDRGPEGGEFTDVQVSGPFRSWEHRHLVTADGPDACYLDDTIEYRLPLGAIGRLFGGALTRRKLERMFDFRHEATRRAVESREP
jgi:ligand-binding SRPBCC domain-containing protein